MKVLTRDKIVYSLDKAHPPALVIEPGEVVKVETHDARTGSIRSDADWLNVPSPGGGNPATGPIAVQGARPGDSLSVHILSIDLADHAWVAVKEGTGLLAERAQRFATRVTPVREGRAHFNDRISLPVRSMIGVIGTAPAGAGVPTIYPGPHGGNMDNRYVRVGTTVHLPVAVQGALLGLGDVHAAMGDGEITMLALEAAAEVTVRVDLERDEPVARPWLETAEAWVTTGEALDPAEALRMAANEMADLLQKRLEIGFDDAYMLMSAAADVQVCQVCEPGKFPVTARTVFPKVSLA
jgi:amidase